MFGSSLQLGDCCLYPAAFQVNLLFPVNVAWQFLTWLAFCCLQQRSNHSHTGRGEWGCVDPVGFVEVLNVDKANNRQGTPVLLQKLVDNYNPIMTIRSWQEKKKKNSNSALRGYTFTPTEQSTQFSKHLPFRTDIYIWLPWQFNITSPSSISVTTLLSVINVYTIL